MSTDEQGPRPADGRAPHIHDWRGKLPHAFEHCCTDNWNSRRICVCGLSEGNRKAHP